MTQFYFPNHQYYITAIFISFHASLTKACPSFSTSLIFFFIYYFNQTPSPIFYKGIDTPH